jgi:hypothetical protein
MAYFISQILVVLGMIFLGLTYISKDKRAILILCILSCSMYSLQYLLIGANTGMFMTLLGVFRAVYFYFDDKHLKKKNLSSLLVLICSYVIFGVISYDGFISLFPVIASIIYTYSVWQYNLLVYRWMAVPVSLLWIIYNISVPTLFGTITECILLTVEIYSIVTYCKNKSELKDGLID